MIDGTYKIQVDVPFGRKEGTIALRTEGDILFAEIDAPVVGKKSAQGHVEGNTFIAQGSEKIMLMGTIDYTLNGVVSGDDLHISIQSSKGDIELKGVRA